MNQDLFKAILAMDSYNRGYDAGIVFGSNPGTNNYSLDTQGIAIGNATIYRNKGDSLAQSIGFYGIAYQLASGEKVISYRGTDNPPSLAAPLTDDVVNGWSLGAGNIDSAQGKMAIEFYQAVAGAQANWLSANISLTGHSLGGGLAGLVAGL